MRRSSAFFQESKKAEAQKVIAKLLGRFSKNGLPLNSANTHYLMALQAFAYPHSSMRGDILLILQTIKQAGTTTVDDFEKAAARITKEHAQRKEQSRTKWTYYLPLHAKLDREYRRAPCISILGTTFAFGRWKNARRRIGKQLGCKLSYLAGRKGTSTPKLDDICLTFSSYGDQEHIAWSAVERSFEVFRGLTELSFGFGTFSYSYPPRPKREIPHPSYGIASSDSGALEEILFDTHYKEPPFPFKLTHDALERIRKTARRFYRTEPARGSTLLLLVNSLRLYSEAMDEHRPSRCLLALWQIAEMVTLAWKYQGSGEKVCERLPRFKNVWRDPLPYLGDVLRLLRTKRNDSVHHGLDVRVTQDDVNILKLSCEAALTWISSHVSNLPTIEHLEQFYQLHSAGNSKLKAIEDCTRFLKTIDRKARG